MKTDYIILIILFCAFYIIPKERFTLKSVCLTLILLTLFILNNI